MLIIDTREGKLIELIKNTTSFTLPYEVKNLQIGDIIISSSKYPDKQLIIERKCMTDMICSIKDGRYKEQKLRLQAEVNNAQSNSKRICYLLEGVISDLRLPNDKTLLYGSIVSSTFRDNIPLIRTNNLNETLDIITRIHDRMNKDINDFFKDNIIKKNTNNTILDTQSTIISTINPIPDTTIINSNHNPEIDLQNATNENNENNTDNNTTIDNNLYLQSIKKCKKENLTPKLWNQITLTNIPGISTHIAIKINEKYKSIKLLLQAYNTCSNEDERIKLISEIILTDTDKQKRRIGPVIAKRIYEYLYLDLE
jgi:ERCC4-type nuclease